MDTRETVLVMAGSTRTGSLNQALARQVAAALGAMGGTVDLVDLADHPMPLYDGDLELREGVPISARRLAGHVVAADTVVIVSPEYNGAFTPLLKNTVDWLTRVDSSILAHARVLLASASPGRGGGATGLQLLRTWLSSMGLEVAAETLSIGRARLGEAGGIEPMADHALRSFVAQVATPGARGRCA